MIATVAFIITYRFLTNPNQSAEINNTKTGTSIMIITSPSFENNGFVPTKFTCDGGDINPELLIQNVPEGTKSLALIVDDPDAPGGTFIHWTVWNIDPKTTRIKEESTPPRAIEGKTSFDNIGYGGPCPPKGHLHKYFFKLYALDNVLNLPAGSSKNSLESAIYGHILAQDNLIGLYQRK